MSRRTSGCRTRRSCRRRTSVFRPLKRRTQFSTRRRFRAHPRPISRWPRICTRCSPAASPRSRAMRASLPPAIRTRRSACRALQAECGSSTSTRRIPAREPERHRSAGPGRSFAPVLTHKTLHNGAEADLYGLFGVAIFSNREAGRTKPSRAVPRHDAYDTDRNNFAPTWMRVDLPERGLALTSHPWLQEGTASSARALPWPSRAGMSASPDLRLQSGLRYTEPDSTTRRCPSCFGTRRPCRRRGEYPSSRIPSRTASTRSTLTCRCLHAVLYGRLAAQAGPRHGLRAAIRRQPPPSGLGLA